MSLKNCEKIPAAYNLFIKDSNLNDSAYFDYRGEPIGTPFYINVICNVND